jgi:putative transposase
VVALAKERGLTTNQTLCQLGLSKASYYRYVHEPVLKSRVRKKQAPPVTLVERLAIVELACSHPLMGYKSLTYLLQNDHLVGVRAHQTYSVLKQERLLGQRVVFSPVSLKKPEPPKTPHQVWHIDLMYVRLRGRWFYLVDIIDGYSRFIVHWSLNPTMQTFTVTQTVQEALERWDLLGRAPAIVHDSGTQFMSKDWRDFVSHHGMPNIRTRIAHPESNGVVERLHRTHRKEALAATDDWTLDQARNAMTQWVKVYNHQRPHHALCGLPPAVYHLGEPEAALAQREHFVQAAAQARTNYWRQLELTVSL